MTLPTLTLPKYHVTVPSTEDTIEFRPFVVREEKILMIALESEEYTQICRALKDVVNTCTFEKLDVENLSIFDLCYVFLNIRAKSVGEIVTPSMLCGGCKGVTPVEINLTDVEVQTNENHKDKIDLGDGVGIKMKYPTLSFDEKGLEPSDVSVKVVADCIEMIYTKDEVFNCKDFSPEELLQFIEDLQHKQFENILEFFETMPKLEHTIKYTCKECGDENTVVLEGLTDFFL
jgi:hypothetical protein